MNQRYLTIAAFVASGMADVGFGVETGARRFALNFIPILQERYFFLCREELLDTPRVATILKILRDPAFQSEVNRLPGYRAVNCGVVNPIAKVFPRKNKLRARRR